MTSSVSRWRAGAPALVAVSLVLATACAPGERTFETFRGEAMSTRWEIVLPSGDGSAALAASLFARVRELETELSEWRDGSPLAAVNRAAGAAPVAVPDDLLRLLERSLELGRRTNGAFDASWAALWGLWDFRAARPSLPDPAEVARRVALVDYRRVVLDPVAGTVFLPEAGMQLGLGGIAKGFALDDLTARLEATGYGDFLIVGGGQVVARGSRGDRPWRIGLRDPRGGPDELFARLDPGDASVSTTADNEAFFEIDGVRYQHVLDPRTGWPARGVRSVTVRHSEATLADALSTALMVLGPEAGAPVAEALGAEWLFVDDAGNLLASPGLEPRLERLAAPRR